uniref:Uncharacterized protein n=1 Tax=Grammatophora oceanica TaxID=210454 RepID=A0A7S1YIB6_9STRA|mmetsp:Transcript_4813/g.6725  ORF Transcript_4813/g.6725 Transcript_4813/m.6725 type:complete len:190 (+) Transcript_4813:553-1122(+)
MMIPVMGLTPRRTGAIWMWRSKPRSTPRNPRQTLLLRKAPSVQDERIVKAATTCTKIDFVRDSETKESEKSYTAALTGAGASLSDEKEANEGPADRCFAEELEQDDEKTYLSLPCHHDRENAVRKEKAAAASEPPKFLDKLRRLPRRSKANEKGVQSLRNGAARPFRFNNFIVKMLVAYTHTRGRRLEF